MDRRALNRGSVVNHWESPIEGAARKKQEGRSENEPGLRNKNRLKEGMATQVRMMIGCPRGM